MSNEISLASDQQAQGVRQVSLAVQKLQETSDDLADVAKQTLQSALNLSEHADKQHNGLKNIMQSTGRKLIEPEAPFDFAAAINAHLDWKMKLSRFMENPDNSLDPDKVCLDNQCALGKWIYGDGANHRQCRSYSPLKSAHADFHKTAGEIIRLARGGKIDQASKVMAPGGKYATVSETCIGLIREMQDEVEG
jgi:methyl-accepting chemotaxis protein